MKKQAAAVLVFLWCLSAAAAVEDWAPSDVLLLAKTPNFSALEDSVKKHPLYQLWQEPSVRAFTAGVREKYRKAIEEFQQERGFSPESLAGLVQGEAALLVVAVQSETGEKVPAAAIVADVGNNSEKVNQMVADATARMPAGSFERVEDSFRGKTLVIYRFSDEAVLGGEGENDPGPERNPAGGVPDAALKSPPQEVAYCYVGSVLFGATDKRLLERLIVAYEEKGEEALSKSSDFQRVTQKMEENPDLYFYLNVSELIRVLEESGNDTLRKVVHSLGFNDVRGLGFCLSLKPEGSAARWFLFAPEPRRGLVALIASPPGDVMPPSWVAENTLEYIGSTLDMQKAWSEARRVLMEEWPQIWMMFQGWMTTVEQQVQMAFSIEKDIIGSLGAGVTILSQNSESDPAGRRVVILGLRDRTAFDNAMQHVQKLLPQLSFTMSDYLGHTVCEVSQAIQPGGVGPGEVPQKPVFVYSTGPLGLVMAGDPEAVKGILRRAGKQGGSLNEKREFAALAARAPKRASGFQYSDDVRRAAAMLKGFKQQDSRTGVGPFWGAMLREHLNWEAVPDEAVLQKYLTQSVSWSTSGEEGVWGESYTSAPQGAR